MSEEPSTLPPGCRIIEGVMTTLSAADDQPPAERANIAPMGPIVDEHFTRFILRPFRTSTTYRNIKAAGQGVFHVTDDVLLLARAAVARVTPGPEAAVIAAKHVEGVVLTHACRYYELTVEELDDAQERTRIVMRTVHHERLRDFVGFNRAAHAVLEAAILATRLHLTGVVPVLVKYGEFQTIVQKTGSEREHQAMKILLDYVKQWEQRKGE